MMHIAFKKNGVGQQLAETLARAMRQGQWSPGARMPSMRQIAREYRVGLTCVQEAWSELARQGLIETRGQRGSYVRIDVVQTPESGPDGDDRFMPPRLSNSGNRPLQIGFPMPIGVMQITSRHLSANSWTVQIIQAVDRELLRTDYHLAVLPFSNDDPQVLSSLLRKIEAAPQGLAGMLCLATSPAAMALLPELDRRQIPWVTLNQARAADTENFVAADNVEGGRQVARLLYRAGARRLLILTVSLLTSRSSSEKMSGLLEGFIHEGGRLSDMDIELCRDTAEQDGYDATIRHLRQLGGRPAPQAIFAHGDILALGAVRACREMGLSVPEQVGVVGSTGLASAAHFDPPLTTLAQPMEAMGQEAARLLLRMIRHGVRRLPGRRVPTNLIVRESVMLPDALRSELNVPANSCAALPA